jgi:hypothetical protein
MTEQRDPRDELRRLIDSVEPVTDADARALASTDRGIASLTAGSADAERRSPPLVAAAVLVVLVVGVGVLAWRQADDDTVTTGPSTTDVPTTLGPATTVLAPVGDDPIVSCDPEDHEWYRLSAWSQPVGAEFEDDPASTALRNYLVLVLGLGTDEPVGPEDLIPSWRRVWESERVVLFGSGDFDLERIRSDALGPDLAIARVELVDGNWQWSGLGSGTCNDLYLFPGEGNSIGRWSIAEEALPLAPDATEIPILLPSWLYPCGPTVTEEDVLGPDVIETDESVTVRAVFDVPDPRATDDDCTGSDEVRTRLESPPDPIRLTLRLRAPLGDRSILDGNRYPAESLNLMPEPEDPRPPTPRIELTDGANEIGVIAVTTPESGCDPGAGPPCGIPPQVVDLTMTAGGDTTEGSTNSMGTATLLVPDGLIRVTAEAEGMWCPTVHFLAERFPGTLTIVCTRLSASHAAVSGTFASSGEGEGWVVTFVGLDPMQSIAVAVEPDGTFEATLAAGTWRVGAQNTRWTQTCTVGPVQSIEVVDGEDHTLDLTCT